MISRKLAAAAIAAALCAASCLTGACSPPADDEKPSLRGTGAVGATRSDPILPEGQRDTLDSTSRDGTSFDQFLKLDESYGSFMYTEDLVELAEEARSAISSQGGDPNGYVKCYPENEVAADGTVTAWFGSPPFPYHSVYYSVKYDPSGKIGDRIEVEPAAAGSVPDFEDDATSQ